ncbi:hypothetical protein RJ641_010205 [Dillenia turbinata]|uniref:Uncharacterized protein n=1 Tax=Dillenia turbinata TaxID=194707 RepID=A0AAN8UY12_9MAGN
MARKLNCASFLLVIFLILVCSEARPFNILKSGSSHRKPVGIEGFFNGMGIGAIKESGPSPGVGHQYTNSETLGGIKDSGPSQGGSGSGHQKRVGIEGFFDGLAIGAIKESGPSPGVGHKYTNSEPLGGIKNSGPSAGGVGH